jgi:hypothetical protein
MMGQAEGNRIQLKGDGFKGERSRDEAGPGGEQDSRIIIGREESVLFSPSPGVPQEEAQKKPRLGTPQ